MFPDDLGARVAVVGRRSGDHLVEHGAEGVQIASPVERRLAEGLLGAHVLDGADGEARGRLGAAAGARARVEELGDAEVEQQHPAGLLFEHHVVGLDVAVHEALGVRVGQRLEDRLGDLHRVGRGVRTTAPQRVRE